MVERAGREPTMEEIVVALRETQRDVARAPHLALVGEASRTAGATPGTADITGLRDGEINRLLEENSRLNQRIVSLLKVIERDQDEIAAVAAERAAIHRVNGQIVRDITTAVEATLRPILLALLHGLEKRRGEPTGARVGDTSRDTAAGHAGWIVDLDASSNSLAPDQEARS